MVLKTGKMLSCTGVRKKRLNKGGFFEGTLRARKLPKCFERENIPTFDII